MVGAAATRRDAALATVAFASILGVFWTMLAAANPPWPHVGAFMMAIGAIDGYLLAPILQKRALETPPALVLAFQLLFGAFWGIIGVMFATPLLGCALIIVRRFATRGVVGEAESSG